jgi:hypothetical protein
MERALYLIFIFRSLGRLSEASVAHVEDLQQTKQNPVALSPQANYTD